MGKGCPLPVPEAGYLYKEAKCSIWKKRNVDNKPRTETSLCLPFSAWKKIGKFHIWCDLWLRCWLITCPLASGLTYKMGCHASVFFIRSKGVIPGQMHALEMSQAVLLCSWSVLMPVTSSGNSTAKAQEQLKTGSCQGINCWKDCVGSKNPTVIHARGIAQGPIKQKGIFSAAVKQHLSQWARDLWHQCSGSSKSLHASYYAWAPLHCLWR